jgi:tetratricopeptide (TPR) repeat protein
MPRLAAVSAAALLCAALLVVAPTPAAAPPPCTDPYDCVEAGEAAGEAGDVAGAVAAFRAALAFPPSALPREHRAQVHFNLGYALTQGGDLVAALAAFEAALALAPGLVPALVKAAFCAKQLGQPGLAAGYLRRAVDLTGGRDPELWSYLGDTLNNLKRWTEAVDAYASGLAALRRSGAGGGGGPPPAQRRQLAADLHASTGDALLNAGNASGALAALRAALGVLPSHGGALASLLLAGADLANWRDREATVARLLAATAAAVRRDGRAPPLTPYGALFVDVDPDLRAAVARAWAVRTVAAAAAPASASEGASGGEARARRRRRQQQQQRGAPPPGVRARHGARAPALRLGYISRRFEDYPGTHLLQGLFHRHGRHSGGGAVAVNATDRRQAPRAGVAVRCFASGPDDGSDARAAVARGCDAFTDVSGASAAGTAATVASAGVDVLLDYDGAHDFNNMPALAARPAALAQASFLGFAGTTGMGGRGPRLPVPPQAPDGGPPLPATAHAVDASVVDPVIAPVEAAGAMFTESLWLLPGTYQPQDPDTRLSLGRYHHHLLREDGSSAADDGSGRLTPAPAPAGHCGGSTPAAAQRWAASVAAIRRAEGLPLAPPPAAASEDDAALPVWACVGADARACGGSDEPRGTINVDVDAAAGAGAAGEPPAAAGSDATPSLAPAAGAVSPPPLLPPFVFASFNRWSKHDPPMWDAWMGGLAGGHPRAVLWVYGGGSQPVTLAAHGAGGLGSGGGAAADGGGAAAAPAVSPHVAAMRAEAAARGVHPGRLVFAPRRPRPAHLTRHYAADAMLDDGVYGAHTTAADGLYTGLPLVTLEGRSMAARVGASLLGAASAPARGGADDEDGAAAAASLPAAIGVTRSAKEFASVMAALSAGGSGAAADSDDADAAVRAGALALLRRRMQDGVLGVCAAQGATCGGAGPAAAPDRLGTAGGGSGGDRRRRPHVYDAATFADRLERAARAGAEAAALQRAVDAHGGPALPPEWHVVVTP